MKFHTLPFLLPALLALTLSCSTSRKATTDVAATIPAEEPKIPEPATYRGSSTMLHDLIHTRLDVSFDWENRQMPGTAELTLKPHFYATNLLCLDARGMEIREVKLMKGDKKVEAAYEYRNDSICVTLDKYYTRTDTIRI